MFLLPADSADRADVVYTETLIKCAHSANLHTCAAFRRGKVYGWIRVRDRVTVWVGVKIRVFVLGLESWLGL